MYFTYEPDPNTMDDYGNAITYRLIVEVDAMPKVTKKPILETDDTTYWYGENDDGFVSFGISHNYRTFNHDPGYMWSSRSSVFNKMFNDISCKEVSVHVFNECGRYGHFGMTFDAIFEHLDFDKEIAIYKDKEDGEVMLEICDRYGSPNTLHDRWELVDTFMKIDEDYMKPKVKKYIVELEMLIDIHDVTRILNYADQGWKCYEMDEFHSEMLVCWKNIEVECDEAVFLNYIKSLAELLPSEARIVQHYEV